MPPKKNQKNQKPKAKADVKKKVEDKTFGMKNVCIDELNQLRIKLTN